FQSCEAWICYSSARLAAQFISSLRCARAFAGGLGRKCLATNRRLWGTIAWALAATLVVGKGASKAVRPIKAVPARLCLTASHTNLTMAGWFGAAARASWQGLGERMDQARAHGGDRVWNVAFRPQGRSLWVDNLRVGQASGRAWRSKRLRGESSPARRSGNHRPRCTAWRDDESRAIRALHNGRARPPA